LNFAPFSDFDFFGFFCSFFSLWLILKLPIKPHAAPTLTEAEAAVFGTNTITPCLH